MISVQSASAARFDDLHRLSLGFEGPGTSREERQRMLARRPGKAGEKSEYPAFRDGLSLAGAGSSAVVDGLSPERMGAGQ